MRRIGSVATVLLAGLLVLGCDGAARHDQQTDQPESGILADPNSREIAKALRMSFPSNTPREERSEWEERLKGYPPTQVALVAEALYEQATTGEERLRIVSEARFFAEHTEARRDALDPLGRMAKRALRDADPQTAAEAAILLRERWWDDEEAEALVRYRLVSATDPDVLAALFEYIPPGKAPAVLQAEIRRVRLSVRFPARVLDLHNQAGVAWLLSEKQALVKRYENRRSSDTQTAVGGASEPSLRSRLHTDRAAGCHRDHRDLGGHAPAGARQGQRKGEAHRLPQPGATGGDCLCDVSSRLRRNRLPTHE